MTTRAKYREQLPQLDGGLFLTDGGLETTLIFHEGLDLPCFAAFVLLDSDRGRKALGDYFDRYVPMAIAASAGFILESPTWRANPDWGAKVGYGRQALASNNRAAIEFLLDLRDRYETQGSPMVVSGAIGPRGDGYVASEMMTADEAAHYHAFQIGVLRDAGADLASAFTMTTASEAQGIALAAKDANIPCAISFTVETDGRLPSGETLADAIESVDAATGNAPGLLHDQLRPPHAFRSCARCRRRVDQAHSRGSRQLIAMQSRRARQRARTRHRRSARTRRPICRAQAPLPSYQRARRLLRHRPPPRGKHQRGLPPRRVNENIGWTELSEGLSPQRREALSRNNWRRRRDSNPRYGF